jgi:hypothetical protein
MVRADLPLIGLEDADGHPVPLGPEVARALLQFMADRLRSGDLPRSFADPLAQWLQAIAEGADANAVLGLKRGRGRTQHYWQHMRIAVSVEEERKRRGLTVEAATAAVAPRWKLREHSVRNIYETHRFAAQEIIRDGLAATPGRMRVYRRRPPGLSAIYRG